MTPYLAPPSQVPMKLVLVLFSCVALASAQFGGFGGGLGGGLAGGLGNAANRFQQGVANIASRLPSPPTLSNVQDFGDFVVSATLQ